MTKMHLYKIEEGLWFHLIPVLENNFDDWQALYESLSDKCVRNQDGYGIFGEVLAFA